MYTAAKPMAVSPTSSATSYSLSEFVKIFELPKRVLVTEGFAIAGKEYTAIATGDILYLLRVENIHYLSAVTVKGKHKVSIPVDCQQKVEIPSPQSSYEPVKTVQDLVRCNISHVKYVRVLGNEKISKKESVKAGEILEILFVDDEAETLVAVDTRGCEVRLPMNCSAGFSLLNYGGEYLLNDLLTRGMLPMTVRFVEPVSPEVRETFIEDEHGRNLGVFYLEKTLVERCGVVAKLIGEDGNANIVWLPFNVIDINVSLLVDQNSSVYQSMFVEPDPKSNTDTKSCREPDNGDVEHKNKLSKPHWNNNMRRQLSGPLETEKKDKSIKSNFHRWKSYGGMTSKEIGEDQYAISKDFFQEKLSQPGSCNEDDDFADRRLPSLPSVKDYKSAVTGTNHSTNIYEEMRGPSKYIDTFDDIPQDLSRLSRGDVLSLLQRMHLDNYAQKFADEQVDGSLLMELNADILTNDFGFKTFHAQKLAKFINGWRPR